MPKTEVCYFADGHRSSPVVDWLESLDAMNPAAFERCAQAIRRLEQAGHELRRPTADSIGGGLYELRAHRGRVQYRLLYFFHGRNIAVLLHGCTKEGRLRIADLQRAHERRLLFQSDPAGHTFPGHAS